MAICWFVPINVGFLCYESRARYFILGFCSAGNSGGLNLCRSHSISVILGVACFFLLVHVCIMFVRPVHLSLAPRALSQMLLNFLVIRHLFGSEKS
jgi:hypothetical protein